MQANNGSPEGDSSSEGQVATWLSASGPALSPPHTSPPGIISPKALVDQLDKKAAELEVCLQRSQQREQALQLQLDSLGHSNQAQLQRCQLASLSKVSCLLCSYHLT